MTQQYPEWEDKIAAYWSRWDEMLIGSIHGTVEVLETLKEHGHRLYVLGNWSREEFTKASTRLPFLELFNDILLSGHCGMLKLAAGIFALAEPQFKLTPQQTVFIDYRTDNVEAALSGNWYGIVFKGPGQLKQALKNTTYCNLCSGSRQFLR